MLHEILFSLLGKTGNIIIETDSKFCIDDSLEFISPSEKEMINRICILGFYYAKIEKFLDTNYKLFSSITSNLIKQQFETEDTTDINEGTSSAPGSSSYVKAFCFAVEHLLDEYRDVILKIEQDFLLERVFTIASLNVRLSKFFYTLPEIYMLIDKIILDGLKGGQIIDLLYTGGNTGNGHLKKIYNTLCFYTYKVLFNQLSGWILYGKLFDFYNEFFIHKIEQRTKDQREGGEIQEEIPGGEEAKRPSISAKKKVSVKPRALLLSELEHDWDSVFSLKLSMLPKTIISAKIAEKILFIGKAARVLQNTKGIQDSSTSLLPSHHLMTLIKDLEDYDTFRFQNTIEKIRYDVAIQLLELIMKKENLMFHLGRLNEYFFLTKGDFFQVLIEESRTIMQYSPTFNTENEFNNNIFQNALRRLNAEEVKELKNFSFKLKKNGFEFKHFSNTVGLNIIGEVKLRSNDYKYIRFEQMKSQKQAGAVWYKLKQNIENGFNITFSCRFKRVSSGANFASAAKGFISPRTSTTMNLTRRTMANSMTMDPERPGLGMELSMNPTTQFNPLAHSSIGPNPPVEDQISNNVLCLVIQNAKELNIWKKNAPTNLNNLNEYLAIKIGIVEQPKNRLVHQKSEPSQSFINITYHSLNKEKNSKKIFEHIFDNDRLSFSEEDLHLIRIDYDCEHIYIYIDDHEPQPNNLNKHDLFDQNNRRGTPSEKYHFEIPIKISKFIDLDMGSAHLGFIQDSSNGNFNIDILSWKLQGASVFNKEDPWNGLTLAYDVKWPLNLILSSQVMEKYSTIFRYFFPIRIVIQELQSCWLLLNRKLRGDRFKPNLLLMRNHMTFALENLWSYFHLDVLAAQWTKLRENVKNIREFEELRRLLEDYLNAIFQQTFLKHPEIVKWIFEIVTYSKEFINILKTWDSMSFTQETLDNLSKIENKFNEKFINLLHFLVGLNKNCNSPFLYQLHLRLDFNDYYNTSSTDPFK